MESSDPLERKWACVAVSNLIQNDPSTRRLLQGKNVVGSLITRLTDSEEEVVVEAAGSLRNLCVDGGFDICAEMYNKNILAPLKTYIPKVPARPALVQNFQGYLSTNFRSPLYFSNTLRLQKMPQRMQRRWSFNFLRMSSPSFGVFRRPQTRH